MKNNNYIEQLETLSEQLKKTLLKQQKVLEKQHKVVEDQKALLDKKDEKIKSMKKFIETEIMMSHFSS